MNLAPALFVATALACAAQSPPLPPGMIVPVDQRKGAQLLIAQPVTVAKLVAPKFVPPPGLRITGISVINGSVTIAWQSGGPANQVQSAAAVSGPWLNVGASTSGSSSTFPAAGDVSLYRVVATYPGQSGSLVWVTNSFTASSQGIQVPTGNIVTDSAGNVAFACTLAPGLSTFGGVTYNVNDAVGCLIVVCDHAGNVKWTSPLWWTSNTNNQGSAGARIGQVAYDSLGNLYVVGQFSGRVDFGGTVLTSLLSVGGYTTPSCFVAKYSGSGALLWAIKADGSASGAQVASCVTVDAANNPVVGGVFSYPSMTIGGKTLTYHSSISDTWIAKLSASDGSAMWATNFGYANSSSNPNAVAMDKVGDAILVGHLYTNQVAKITGSSGAIAWIKSPAYGKTFYCVTTTTNANNIIVGGNNGSDWFGCYDSNLTTNYWSVPGYQDGGNAVWGLAIDANDNLYVGGLDTGVYYIKYPNGQIVTGNGAYIAKFAGASMISAAPTCTLEKELSSQSNGSQAGTYGLALDNQGRLLVCGFIWGNGIVFDSTPLPGTGGVFEFFMASYLK